MASPGLKRAIIGILFITVGTLFLLDNLGYDIDVPYYLFSWPAVFVVLGFINILSGNIRAALIFFGLATIFYLQYYDIVNLRDIWPVILIVIGLSFFFRKKINGASSRESTDDYIDEVAIFGGTEKKFIAQELKGGKITSIFGSCEIDLKGSKAQENAKFEVFCLFGGVELILPEDWKVNMNATAILGGFSDSRKNLTDKPTTTIHIKGFTMLGGGEIKS